MSAANNYTQAGLRKGLIKSHVRSEVVSVLGAAGQNFIGSNGGIQSSGGKS